MSKKLVKKLIIGAYEKQIQLKLLEKYKKKGELIKILNSNTKRSKTLVEIFKSDINIPQTAASETSKTTNDEAKKQVNYSVSDDEFLKKYNQMPKGGPKYSIAVKRAHHLTNFLSEYLINAFQSGHFTMPEISEHLNKKRLDSNGFVIDKYSFEISNIELPTDLTRLKIYWLNSGNEKIDLEIEKYLTNSLKNQIRSTLTEQRIMNYVPEVEFIRDNTKVLMNQLDEYLLKIKLDHNENDDSLSDESSNIDKTKKTDVSIKKVDNLYGVNFTRLVESIKKNSDHVPWSNEKEQEKENDSTELTTKIDEANLIEAAVAKTNEFEVNLKAFQINQRLKRQRLNKTAILKLETMKYHESLLYNNNNDKL
jgi:ribosome-binding factor A